MVTSLRLIWLIRHGATEWSESGRHTGATDIPVIPRGEAQATAVGRRLAELGLGRRAGVGEASSGVGTGMGAVWSSPRQRARRTCDLALAAAGLEPPGTGGAGIEVEVRPDLAEWDYGSYEGLTSAEIAERDPGWTIWTDGGPGGESPGEVCARADQVIADLLRREGQVALFSHGHFLRALAARWLGLEVAWGRTLTLGAGSLSALGFEHQDRTIHLWNDQPA